jgi:hypothetical protein
MPAARNNIFIIFVDALFTTLQKPLFTKASGRFAKTQAVLACGVSASPINSPAT